MKKVRSLQGDTDVDQTAAVKSAKLTKQIDNIQCFSSGYFTC